MTSAPLFWLIALLVVAATLAALIRPLLRARGAPAPDADDVATADVYRDHKRQLDDELAAGVITRDERDGALDELAGRLGAELHGSTAAVERPASTRAPRIAAIVVAAALPVTALGLYGALGSPQAMRTATATPERAGRSPDEIASIVDKLAARMKEQPDDPLGWKLLARAYLAMRRYPESVAAFAEARARSTQDDASLLVDWADAVAMHNQSLEGEPARLVARALALEPDNPKALSLSASAAFERNDYDAAIADWRRLQKQFPAESDAAKAIGAMIADADTARRAAPGTAKRSDAPVPAPRASAITGSVTLDPALRDRAGAGDTLFIFARAVDGPRMPLAVIRTKAGQLPNAFRLDDSMSMTPESRLSAAASVVVEARISKTGSATPMPGDLQGSSAAVKPGATDVAVVIRDIVR
jgi:cytochrome c-type biogenesis protein CcmH